MRVLLVSTYEMGHQPLSLATAASALTAAGHEVRLADLAVERWNTDDVRWCEAAAFSAPMHTAMRLAMGASAQLRQARPDVRVCFFGLYAGVSKDRTLGEGLADRLIEGEYETELVAWANEASSGAVRSLQRQHLGPPSRDGLPPLESYAHLERDGERVPAGYVEATRGCAHRCRHCPVPVVYDGRTRRVEVETVLSDVEGLVNAGAKHITFGDPDFLNRPRHATAVVEAVHGAFPQLSYDITTKVEHILKHADLWPMFSSKGCLFVVSAFEILNDRILELLDKGHTAAEAGRAVHLLRDHAVELRPSWLPFMPWTTVEDVADILDFVVAHDLVGNVDPVQYSIRLLIPEGSLLLEVPEMQPWLGPYDDEALTYRWRAEDQRTELLQKEIAAIVERDADAGASGVETFLRIREAVTNAGGEVRGLIEPGSVEGRPRLTEPWFC